MKNAKSMKGAYNWIRYISFSVTPENTLYSSSMNEGVIYQPDRNHRGGIITFSTDVNCERMDENVFINALKRFFITLRNRMNASKMVDRIAINHELPGWMVGHFLNGRYTDYETGQTYNEKSLSVEIVGVDSNTLVNIAGEICKEFKQQSVLVKDYSDGIIMFVDKN